MNNSEHDSDAAFADLTAGWRGTNDDERVTVAYAVIGLTNFGERPVQSTRLAEVLGRSVSEAEALARQWGWPGTRVDGGLISVNPERARSAPRRGLRVGNRQFGVTGCAGDIFLYAALVRPSLEVEETCPTTGTPIRLVFTPKGVESVDPGGAVLPMPSASTCGAGIEGARDIDDVDANL